MGKKTFDTQTNLIIDLYVNKKKTMKDIASIIGNISYSTINRILKANNIQIRKKGCVNDNTRKISSPFKQVITDNDKFQQLYANCVSIKEIAKEFNVGIRAVQRKVKELGLKRLHSMNSRKQYDDKNDQVIVQMYKNGYSPNEIAKHIGLTRCAIKKHLIHNNIHLRNISEGLFKFNKKDFPEELQNYETLYDMYVIRRLSKKDISETLNVSPSVVDRCLKNFDIHIRNSSESKYYIFSGKKHPNWKGGRSGLYVRIREYFKTHLTKKVLRRDNYTCQLCGKTKKLHVHHIIHFKEIFDRIINENKNMDIKIDEEKLYNIMISDKQMNDMDNLITYCKDCHLYKIHGYKKAEKI